MVCVEFGVGVKLDEEVAGLAGAVVIPGAEAGRDRLVSIIAGVIGRNILDESTLSGAAL